MKIRNRNPPWADLPQELLSAIAETLAPNPIWVLTFRSICKSWRSSFPPLSNPTRLSPFLPCPVPRPPFQGFSRFLSSNAGSLLTVTVIYALRHPIKSTTWILFLDEFSPGILRVRKPFTSYSYPAAINFPRSFNLIDFSVVELGRFYSVNYSYSYSDCDILGRSFDKPRFFSDDVDKVVLFPDELGVIALLKEGKLGVCGFDQVGQCGISKWEIIHDGKRFRFDDIVEFKGRVLGIDRRGRVYEIGYHSYDMNVVFPPIAGGGGRRKRLVVSLGLLYLVVRSKVGHFKTDKIPEFKVYELDERRKKWIEINSLGDRSFFFGCDFSFSASVQELGASLKNCILFKKQSFQSYCNGIYDDDQMFSKSDRCDLFIGVCNLNEVAHVGLIESYPGYSDMLWPPPPWFWSLNRTERIGFVEIAIDKILERVPENFKIMATEDSCDDLREQAVFKAVGEILRFKEMVTTIQACETELLYMCNKLKEALSIQASGETGHILNQLDSVLALVRTAGHGTEEGLGCPDELQTGTEQSDRGNASFLRVFLHTLRKHDSLVFHLEERFSEMERSSYGGLKRILTS